MSPRTLYALAAHLLPASLALAPAACGDDGATAHDPDGGVDAPVDAATSAGPIATWTDAPGSCPAGSTRIDLHTAAELAAAARGETALGTCYFLHDGVYQQVGTSPVMYIKQGGRPGAPVVWVGESRAGVVIRGRASLDPGVDHVVLRNLTFDLSGYSQSGSFNTISILASTDVVVSHVNLTGDCQTGLRGGAIEVDGGTDITIADNLIERFGQCNGDGHLDHGVYLGSGARITVRNNLIRENSSRGIQLNTEGGQFGTLTDVAIDHNRITGNGHRDYEDGIVLNGSGTGTIERVTIARNVIDGNRYSGIRFVGDVVRSVTIDHNTFVGNGGASTASDRSELNLDEGTPQVTATRNLFVPARTVVNTCVPGLQVLDSAVHGDSTGACVTGVVAGAPGFVDAAAGDFRPTNPLVTGYGAYAP